MAEITLENILANTSNTPLSREEELVLIEKNYVVTSSSPKRIQNNTVVLLNSYCLSPSSVDVSKIDFNAPEVNEYFCQKRGTRLLVYNQLRSQGIDVSHFPYANELSQMPKNNPNSSVYYKLEQLIELNQGASCIPHVDVSHLTPDEQKLIIDFMSKNKLTALAIDFDFIYKHPDMFKHLPDYDKVMAIKDFPHRGRAEYLMRFASTNPPIDHLDDGDVNRLTKEELDFLIEYQLSKKISLENYPSSFLKDEAFLRRYKQSVDPNLSEAAIAVYLSRGYDSSIEKMFCESMGVASIEEYIEQRCNNPKFNTTLAEDCASYKIFMEKKLYLNGTKGVEVKLNKGNGFSTAYYDPEFREVAVKAETLRRDPKQVYYACAHECNHANQHYNRDNFDFEKDDDIDTYEKDDFLRERNNDYYHTNYLNYSSEFKADQEAAMEVYNIIHPQRNLFDLLKAKISKRAVVNQEELQEIKLNIAYAFSRTRKDGANRIRHLDDLVAEELDKKLSSSPSFEAFEAEIKEKHPLLAMEYKLTPEGVRKKTPKELVNDLNNSSSPKEYNAYRGLIRSSMDVRKSNSFSKNIMEYRGLMDSPSLPYDIRSDLTKDVNASMVRNEERIQAHGWPTQSVSVGVGRGVGV